MNAETHQNMTLPMNARTAERWAYEFHAKVMGELPPQIRQNIDWDLVAADLESESPATVPMNVLHGIVLLTNYLFTGSVASHDVVEGKLLDAVTDIREWLSGMIENHEV